MTHSLRVLYSAPYNKTKPLFAIRRFLLWKWIKLLKLNDKQFKVWGDRYLYLNHDSFQSMWIMYNYIVDWEEFNLISKYIKSNDHVADVGANMGFYSIWLSKFVMAPGKIHAFEPDAHNFVRLQNNISLNRLEASVQLNNLAVTEQNGVVNFTVGMDGENHIAKTRSSKAVQVNGVTLDKYVALHNISELTYVKIDVEGFELSVLKGAHQLLLQKRIQIIQIEINQTIKNSGANIEDLLDKINSHGYKLCRYSVDENLFVSIAFSAERENYFAVYDVQKANERLKSLI